MSTNVIMNSSRGVPWRNYSASVRHVIRSTHWSRLDDHPLDLLHATLRLKPALAHFTLEKNRHYRADSRFAPSQWETALLCNDVSHWLGARIDDVRPRKWPRPATNLWQTTQMSILHIWPLCQYQIDCVDKIKHDGDIIDKKYFSKDFKPIS